MRWRDLFNDPNNGMAEETAKADKIAKAKERKKNANLRYQAKVRAAQDSAKLASTASDPLKAQERRDSANKRISDARGVFQRTVASADDTINNALAPRKS